jgi:hypothetical protein
MYPRVDEAIAEYSKAVSMNAALTRSPFWLLMKVSRQNKSTILTLKLIDHTPNKFKKTDCYFAIREDKVNSHATNVSTKGGQ